MNQSFPIGYKPRVVVYSFGYEFDACSIIRILGPMMVNNWNVIWASKRDNSGFIFDLEASNQADLIIIQRMFPSKFTEKILNKIMTLGIPVVYDLDDMLLNIPSHLPIYKLAEKERPYMKWILKEADIVTVSTIPLKNSLSRYTSRPIIVNPNIVDFNLFFSQPKADCNKFNFLVSGSKTHQRDWAIIEEPISEILAIYKEKVNFVFFGDIPNRFLDNPLVKAIDFQQNYNQYAKQLKNLNVHAALIPLEDTEFNQCKSNIKWLEYSAAGIPGIYSDIAPYNSCISHNRSGLLVKNNPDSWVNAMKELLTDSEKRIKMLNNAQREVLENFSIENTSGNYTNTVASLFGQEHKKNIFSELPIFHYHVHDTINDFLDRHIFWRFK